VKLAADIEIAAPRPKLEARSSKIETNGKRKIQRNKTLRLTLKLAVWIIVASNFAFCFGFRFSDFVLQAWEL
jgi:hypothetical protein